MISRRTFIGTAAAGATAMAVGGCAREEGSSILKVGIHPVMVSPLWNAYQQGLFMEHEVDIEFVGFTTGPSQTAALNSGVIDLAWGAATTFYTIRSSGAPVQWVGTVGNFNGADGMVVGPNSAIRSVRDLAGKKIALPFYTVVHGPLKLLLEANGVPPGSVELVNLAPPQAAASVLSGTVDAAFVWPPFLDGVVERGGHILLRAKDTPGGGWSWTGFAANQRWANANADMLARFFRAFDAGRAGLEANRERIVETAASVGGMPKKAAQHQFDQVKFPPLVSNVIPGTDISMCSARTGPGIARTLDQAREFYRETGQVKTPADYADYLNPEPLNMAFGKECRV